MKRWVGITAGAALVAAAWGVAALTPQEGASEVPFTVIAELGEQAVGRDIAVTVTGVRRAETVRAGEWSADGNWVIVDLDAEAVVSEHGNLLSLVTLEVGGRTFDASERPDSLARTPLSVGISRSGSVAFELPADVTGGTAVLRVGVDSDPRLDSLIVVDIDLDAISIESDAELVPSDWSAR